MKLCRWTVRVLHLAAIRFAERRPSGRFSLEVGLHWIYFRDYVLAYRITGMKKSIRFYHSRSFDGDFDLLSGV